MNYFSYFSEIEEAFVRYRGKNLLLSPLDWALIEAWKERGVPLHIVLRALDNVFDSINQQPARKKQVKSLLYCRDEVENLYAAWLETQIGNSPHKSQTQANTPEKIEKVGETKFKTQSFEQDWPFSRAQIKEHLQDIKQSLQINNQNLNGLSSGFKKNILQILQKAESEFEKNSDIEAFEQILSELDRKIDEFLPKVFVPEKLAVVKSETAGQIKSYQLQMSREAYEQTFQTLLLKNLREQIGLSRLSLFYL